MHTMAVHLTTTGWLWLAAAAAAAVIVAVLLILFAVRRARRRAAGARPRPTPAGTATSEPATRTPADSAPAPRTPAEPAPGTRTTDARPLTGGATPVAGGRARAIEERSDPAASAAGSAGSTPSAAGAAFDAGADAGRIGPGDVARSAPGAAVPPGSVPPGAAGSPAAGPEAVPLTGRRWSEIDMRELAAASRQLARPVLRGVVTGGAGEPLADAVLTVINVRGGQAGNARTGADGGYQLTMPAEGGYVVIARGANHEPHAATVEVHGVLTTCDIRLSSSAGLTGVVADADGRPVPDATVIVTNTSGAVVLAQRSNARGGFTVADLTPGLYTVTATAPAREPVALLVDVPPTGVVRQDVTFAPRTLTLAGTTRHADGRPLPDIRVCVVDGTGVEVATTYSDAAGRYEFTGLTPGHYTVAASGYPRVDTALDAVTGVADHDIRLGYAGPPAGADTVHEEYAQ